MKRHIIVAVLVLFCTRVVADSCPAGAFKGLSKDKCVEFVEKPLSWYDAEAECNRQGGYLASITSAFQEMFLANATAYIVSDDQFWTGGRLISVPQWTWAWSDGSPWAYETWADGQPTYKPSSCLLLNTELLLNHNWFSESCSDAHQYICEVPSVKQPCPLDWFRISSSSFCYKLVTSKQNWGTWTNALEVCRNNYQGDLASIPSSQVNHEIRMQVLKVSGDTEFWIGAHRVNETSDFVWSDGCPLVYTNWDDGQPQFTYGETAVYMDESGYWSSSDGDAAARSFLCEKPVAY